MKLELSLALILVASVVAGIIFQSLFALISVFTLFVLLGFLLFSRLSEKTKSLLAFGAGILILILIGAYGHK